MALDIDAPREGRGPNFALMRDLADVCFMPFTAGGGVRGTADVRKLLRSGADKVAFNTAIFEQPEVIRTSAQEFGVQCVVASIDARRIGSGHEAFVDAGRRATGRSAVEHARIAADLGAGEILLTSMDQDGTMEGYDLDLLSSVTEAVAVPVIACGGAGKPEHFVAAIRDGGVAAVSAASLFHFTRFTPNDIKRYMKEAGIDVRI